MIAMITPTILGLLMRHALTAAGVFLASNGLIEAGSLDQLQGCFEVSAPANDTATTLIGGAMALGGLLWSGGDKLRRN